MRRPVLLLVATLAVVASCLGAGSADAQPGKQKAELVAKHVTVALASGKIQVSATVKNKGTDNAEETRTEFLLSKDGTVSGDDAALGSVVTPPVKLKRNKTVSASFTVPPSLAPGTYHAIACVDAGHKVKERKENNDCKASKATMTISKITVTWSSTNNSPNGTVTGTATGGSCTAPGETGSCTVFAGASTVTLTAGPGPAPIIAFEGWQAASPGSCSGAPTASSTLTFTNPTASQSCVAAYDFTI